MLESIFLVWIFLSPLLADASDPSLHWGTYRPNLYFGTRTRSPASLMTGLMYSNVGQVDKFPSMRHECKESDNLEHYGWAQHDARSYGKQNIHDKTHGVNITTQFLKLDGDGKDWSIRISGVPYSDKGMRAWV